MGVRGQRPATGKDLGKPAAEYYRRTQPGVDLSEFGEVSDGLCDVCFFLSWTNSRSGERRLSDQAEPDRCRLDRFRCIAEAASDVVYGAGT